MSSRFPPNAGDSRYPRERSPPRYDRRSANEGRSSDPGYDRNESYGGRGALSRDPPRGPKAQIGRGPFQGRGRGFVGRGDGREREFRDDTFGRGRGRGQDWDSRDRYEARDRRTPPLTRTRSRSPYREPRDLDPALRRRNSRDGPLPSTDAFPLRGRGGHRGRGRGDWEYSRGKSYYAEDRPYDQGSHPRDRQWDPQTREHTTELAKRDEDQRTEKERGREDRSRSEQVPYRPDSRNSYGASRSTSTASIQPNTQDHLPQSSRNALEASREHEKAHTLVDNRAEKEGPARELERSSTLYRRPENDRHNNRASSPPPVPSVPAFGSVVPQTTSGQDSYAKVAPPKEEEPQIHPSRRALLDPAKETALPSSNLLKAPTAPKAQQRLSNEDSGRAASNLSPAAIWPRDAPREPVSNWSKRFPHPNAPTAPRASSAEQPSVRKAIDEEGRNGNVPSSSNLKAASSDSNALTSPMRIPTGPRAGRQAPPSIRQPMQPSIRAPITNRGPSIMGRGQRQPSTWSWTNPALLHTGPQIPLGPAPRGPSIMNRVPTKRDAEADEEKPRVVPVNSALSVVEQWRQKNLPTTTSDIGPEDKAEQRDQGISRFSTTVIEKDRISPDAPFQEIPDESGRDISEDEIISDNDVDMDLDDADFQKAQRNHERDLRRLEARRPPAPWNDPEILQMLEELEILATALQDSSAGDADIASSGAIQHSLVTHLDNGLAIKPDEEEGLDVKSEHASDEQEIGSFPGTPALESLPFLRDGSPTPFSEFEELKTPCDEDGDIGGLISTKLQQEHNAEAMEVEDARLVFSRIFKSWRREMDIIDATIREEQERDNSTPPENTFDAAPVPQTVRSRRIVSDYGFEAIIQESKETAAREEQARRLREERDAQIYVPTDTFNPEREAIVPAMLGPTELQDAQFLDFNNQIDQHSVLEALRYIPPKDDFTKKEHTDFLYHYVTMPKRFGEISDKLADHRTYRDCVRHYYASKRGTNYRNQENRFYKTHRGKRFKEATDRAAAGGRPRGGLLASFDGAIDQEAQNAALTESGRPRRAAAPTFGEAPEPENAPAVAITPSRRPTIGKDGVGSLPSAEKSTARRGKTGTGQKPGRKPKGQPLLAAAPPISPAPSPLKAVTDIARPVAADATPKIPHADEHEAAQLLAALPTSMQSYPQPSYTEHWVTGQVPYTAASAPPPAQEPNFPRRPEQGSQPPPQSKPHQVPETTSYWSVPEKQDFINYVSHFGTNWQIIAQTMKTKTTQMIKNHYVREVDPKKGDKGRDLMRAAAIADDRIKRNEDMGPVPDPTPVQPKRRYDSHTSRDSQRPLAPSIDLTGGGNDSPSLGPTKTQMSPPSLNSTTPRFSASSQAEQKAAASSAQVLAQGPQSPANRNVLHMQHLPQRMQNVQGPQMGIFTENRSRPGSQARPLVEGTRREENEQEKLRAQQQKQHQHQQQQQQQQQQKVGQDFKENQQPHRNQQEFQLRQQEIQREFEAREQAAQGQLRRSRLQQDQSTSQSSREPQIISLNEGNVPHVEVDEQSRRIFEQRYGHEIPRGRQDEKFRPSDVVHRPTHTSSTSSMQQALAGNVGGTLHRINPSHSPRTPKMPVPPISRMEPPRPSSVPAATPAPPPQPAQPKKTSNIMSLLNSEPEEPKVSKRHSDPRAGASTPDPLIAARRFQPTSRAPSQQFARPETPSQLATQQVQNLTLDQQMKQQQQRQDPPGRSGPMRDMSQGIHRSSIDEILLHQARPSISQPSFETSYLPSSSSRPGLVPLRDRGPVSPPAPHSRTSSYSSMNQQMPPSHHQEPRTSISQATADSRLRPSPYANLTPPQHQNTQQQYPPSQQQQQPPLQQQQQQLSHTFNAPQQREIRQDEHRRSLDSHEGFQRQQGPRPILLDHRAPSHEDIQAMERQYLANHLANQQQEAMQQEMRERRRRQEQEQELLRRHHLDERRREQAERERGARGIAFYPAQDGRR